MAGKIATALLAALAVASATGCRPSAAPNASSGESAATMTTPAARLPKPVITEDERAQLAQVPVPMKSHYMGVATADAWQNPFLVVGTDSLKVIVILGDPNPSPMGAGGLLRPQAARKDIEQIAPDKLAEMLAALPANAWPYGRVIAMEESKLPERADRAAMRRNYEQAIQTLTSLGVVVDEWNEPASSR